MRSEIPAGNQEFFGFFLCFLASGDALLRLLLSLSTLSEKVLDVLF
jgi:hypothetical protein